MSGTETLWETPAIQAMAWALVHFLWQGALAGLAAAGFLSLLKNGRANVRYAVAAIFLLLMAALPVATAVRLASTPEAAPAFAGAPPLRQTSPSSPGGPGVRLGEEGRGDEGLSAAALPSVLPWIFGLWLAGVAFLSVYHLGGWRVARRLSRQGRAPGERLESMVRDLCRRLQIERAVILLESAAVSVPAVIGVLRPVILVPASALAGLSPQQLEAVLAHELAHVRRHDYLINLLQAAVETLLFYHPAVWWISSQMRRERENCCDDLAVAICGDRLGYARALANLEGLRAPSPRLAMAADGGSLLERIRRLVGAPAPRSRRSWAAGLLALALLPAGAAIQLACSHGTAAKPESRLAAPSTDLAGTWTADLQGDQLQFEVKMRVGYTGHWALRDTYPVSRFTGFSAGPNARFELGHDAGTFHFQGGFVNQHGQGTATFSPNPEFSRLIGVPLENTDLLELSARDISLGFTREMKELGYVSYPRETHGVHDALRSYFRREVLGHRDRSVERLIELQTHGITPDYIRAMKAAGYGDLGPSELIELHEQGVDADFIRKAAGQSGRRLLVPEILSLHTRGGRA